MSVELDEGPVDGDLADEWLTIESIDLDAQGVAHSASGKVMFVEGALPGEQVQIQVERSKNNWARGSVTALRRESSQRVTPACPHFGVCGGCKMQHLDVNAQVAVKQRAMEDALWHVGKVRPAMVLRPISGPAWGYRHRARLSLFYHVRERRMLIGFHERQSSHVADIAVCPVMPARMSGLIGPLHALILSMEQRQRLPQIEVAVGNQVIALVLRHLKPLNWRDLDRLRAFAAEHAVQWWLQPAGPDSARKLEESIAIGVDESSKVDANFEGAASTNAELSYTLPEFDIRVPYRPTNFTQVNPYINRALVNRALQLLDPLPDERVIDWFCGMGNFTLPIARRAARVLGVEGSVALVKQAAANAMLHSLQKRTKFEVVNLFELDSAALAAFDTADKWLIDPPRDGAFALIKALVALIEQPSMASGFLCPSRIVYVSCDPSTLARDAGLLVHRGGYRCTAAGVVNMFPHTAHVESIAVFDRAL